MQYAVVYVYVVVDYVGCDVGVVVVIAYIGNATFM